MKVACLFGLAFNRELSSSYSSYSFFLKLIFLHDCVNMAANPAFGGSLSCLQHLAHKCFVASMQFNTILHLSPYMFFILAVIDFGAVAVLRHVIRVTAKVPLTTRYPLRTNFQYFIFLIPSSFSSSETGVKQRIHRDGQYILQHQISGCLSSAGVNGIDEALILFHQHITNMERPQKVRTLTTSTPSWAWL